MAKFVGNGRKRVNLDHITAVEQTASANSDGKGRKIRVDFLAGQPVYLADDEIPAEIDALFNPSQPPRRPAQSKDTDA